MSGSVIGGKKAAKANKEREPGFYARIGALGGKRSTTGGFAANIICNCDIFPAEHYKRRCAGVLGGRKSKRTSSTGGDNA